MADPDVPQPDVPQPDVPQPDVPQPAATAVGRSPAPPLPRWVRIGFPAVLFGVIDAVVVAKAGRPVGSAVGAGVMLGVFIALTLGFMDRARSRRRAADGDRPQAGSWSNPTARQRWISRIVRFRNTGRK